MASSMLIIENKTTGETYAVSPAVFRRQYEPLGFVPIRHEDGSEYEPPTKKAGKGTEDAQDAPSAAEGA